MNPEKPNYYASPAEVRKHIETSGPETKSPRYPIVVYRNFVVGDKIGNFVQRSFDGLKEGKEPKKPETGSGGSYLIPDSKDNKNYISVFKPSKEEPNEEHYIPNSRTKPLLKLPKRCDGMTFSLDDPKEGLKEGIRAGGGAPREFAAYLLDHPKGCRRQGLQDDDSGFAGVPPTLLVYCISPFFNYKSKDSPEAKYEYKLKNYKVGSLQMYMENHGSCSETTESDVQKLDVIDVHKICLVDIRYANLDRHGNNILYHKNKNGTISLIPIDHGGCFPQKFAIDYFKWMDWKEAKQSFGQDFKDYIKELDAKKDFDQLKKFGFEMSKKSEITFRMSTMLLKEGVESGLTPFQIGKIMCRKGKQHNISDVEGIADKAFNEIVYKAMNTKVPGKDVPALEYEFLKNVSSIIDEELRRSTDEEQK